MTTVDLKISLASITDEVSGGFSTQISIPSSAEGRNKALQEAMKVLLKKEKEIGNLRGQLDSTTDMLKFLVDNDSINDTSIVSEVVTLLNNIELYTTAK